MMMVWYWWKMVNETAFLLFFSQEVWTTPPSHHLQMCNLHPCGWLDFKPESKRCCSRHLCTYVYVYVHTASTVTVAVEKWDCVIALISISSAALPFSQGKPASQGRRCGERVHGPRAFSLDPVRRQKNMDSLSAFNEKLQAQRADVEESIRAEHPFLSFSQLRSVGDLSHTWRNVCHLLLFDNASP